MGNIIDLRSVCCPMNFVQAKLALESVENGMVVEIFLDDGEAVRNLPRSLKFEGHRLLGLKECEGHYILTMEKVAE